MIPLLLVATSAADSLRLGIGGGIAGASTTLYGLFPTSDSAIYSASINTTASIRLRLPSGLILEPATAVDVGGGVRTEAGESEESSVRDTGLSLAVLPRLGVKDERELYGAVRLSASTVSNVEPAFENAYTRVGLDAGMAIQRWVADDIALSANTYLLSSYWLGGEYESIEEQLWAVGLRPTGELMVHLYW